MIGRDRFNRQVYGLNTRTSILPYLHSARPYTKYDNTMCLAYSPRGTAANVPIIAIASEDGHVSIRGNTWQGLYRFDLIFPAHNNAIFHMAWPHCSDRIITASGDSEIRLWYLRVL
jgi:WD40 repeat protein